MEIAKTQCTIGKENAKDSQDGSAQPISACTRPCFATILIFPDQSTTIAAENQHQNGHDPPILAMYGWVG